MSLAKRPLRATRAGLVAGLAALTLVTTAAAAPTAAATSRVPATTATTSPAATAAAVRNGTGLGPLPEGLTPAERAAEIFCRHLEHAARHGAVPEEALAFCKHVNGWD
ncbi:hypothetical protein RB196_30735 [Streptomyces sp. PmtA]|uniref:hypothetical protein n=1 Tax=Streptomyces sp. PmtA TaxID=3074275 RepID=UPI0030151122